MDHYYPTASTVAVFLNGLHIDQAYRIDYKDNIPKMPIFGYNDYEFTQVARGKGYVQGLLIINFTVPYYLTNVIESRSDAFVPRLYNYSIPSKDQSNQYKNTLLQSFKTDLPPNGTQDELKARAEYIASFLSKKTKSEKKDTKDALYRLFQGQDDGNPNEPKTIVNPLIAHSNTKIGNTIDVYYTDPQDANWFVRFNDVHFFDVNQQSSMAGAEGSSEPLYEIYSFIAKSKEIRVIE